MKRAAEGPAEGPTLCPRLLPTKGARGLGQGLGKSASCVGAPDKTPSNPHPGRSSLALHHRVPMRLCVHHRPDRDAPNQSPLGHRQSRPGSWHTPLQHAPDRHSRLASDRTQPGLAHRPAKGRPQSLPSCARHHRSAPRVHPPEKCVPVPTVDRPLRTRPAWRGVSALHLMP